MHGLETQEATPSCGQPLVDADDSMGLHFAGSLAPAPLRVLAEAGVDHVTDNGEIDYRMVVRPSPGSGRLPPVSRPDESLDEAIAGQTSV